MFIKNIRSVRLARNGNRCIPTDFGELRSFFSDYDLDEVLPLFENIVFQQNDGDVTIPTVQFDSDEDSHDGSGMYVKEIDDIILDSTKEFSLAHDTEDGNEIDFTNKESKDTYAIPKLDTENETLVIYHGDPYSLIDGFYFLRPKRNGKYGNAPVIRFCDLKISTDYDGIPTTEVYKYFDVWVRNPFLDVKTFQKFNTPSYEYEIHSPIDSFEKDEVVKLIALNSDMGDVIYDGNNSNIMFEAKTHYTEHNIDDETQYTQHLTIVNSNLRSFDTGVFQCTVLKDTGYKSVGGLVTVAVKSIQEDIMDNPNQCWIKIPSAHMTYRELPEEFVLTPNNIEIPTDVRIRFSFKTEYVKNVHEPISSNVKDLYRYYLDTKHNKRIPVSNVLVGDHKRRLVINQDLNPNIKTVQTSYVGICRYSLREIPKDGYINLTGFLPTPLNRDRYEFWVNGRFLRDEVIILSPTSIMLHDLKSLYNFEVIELVDDVDTTIDDKNNIMKQGVMYTDLEGNRWYDYKKALLSNSKFIKQDLRYMFNVNQHKKIHDHVPQRIIHSPNNHNFEENILKDIKLNDDEMLLGDSNPTLNGIELINSNLTSIGIQDIPNHMITELYDKHWKKEILTNPLFPMTHKNETEMFFNSSLRIIVYAGFHEQQIDDRKIYKDDFGNVLPFDFKGPGDDLIITVHGVSDRYFTLYVTDEPDKKIYDKDHVKKIIPYITSGVYVLLPRKQYRGMWINSTIDNMKSVRIL